MFTNIVVCTSSQSLSRFDRTTERTRKMSHSQVDLFMDSQSNSTQEDDNDVYAVTPVERTSDIEPGLPIIQRPQSSGTMQKILAEMRKLREEVQALRAEVLGELKRAKGPLTFHVESSNVKKPLIAFLKEKFSEYPWLSEEDDDLKREINRIIKNAGYIPDGGMVTKCLTFSYTNFTNWRSQVRQKIISEEKDVPAMNLNELQRYIFSAFHVRNAEKTRRLTLALRAFVDNHKLWKRRNVEIDFWKCFRRNLDAMLEQSSEKWMQLQKRMERKIEESHNKEI